VTESDHVTVVQHQVENFVEDVEQIISDLDQQQQLTNM
jgi:hypothetical protein